MNTSGFGTQVVLARLTRIHSSKTTTSTNTDRSKAFTNERCSGEMIDGGGAIRRWSDSDEELLGFEPELEPAKVGRRKRKANAANLPPAEVRRSKHLREKNRSFECDYYRDY